MNILVAASRGGGLEHFLKGYNLKADVTPGGKLKKLTERALTLIPPPSGCTYNKPHVYIMAGIPDITDKHISQSYNYQYTECTYTEDPQDTVARLKKEINNCKEKITKAGAIPIFCTITQISIINYNQHLLNQRKTSILYHKDHYAEMQRKLEPVINEINHFIDTTNHNSHMSTPFCHTAIRNRRGKKGKTYWKNIYTKLRDGVHGTPETRKLWAQAIEGAIRNNRRNTDDPTSPKRSWRRERRPPLNF